MLTRTASNATFPALCIRRTTQSTILLDYALEICSHGVFLVLGGRSGHVRGRSTYRQSNLSDDAFSLDAPLDNLRAENYGSEYSKNISSGKELPFFYSSNKHLGTFSGAL